MQLIIITPDKDTDNETVVVNDLFANGLKKFHLRKPSYSTSDYRKYINAIAPEYHMHIVLNGAFELMNEFNVGGVHLNSWLRNDETIRAQLAGDPGLSISTSFHSWQEVLDNEFGYKYVFISPVFDSISKQGYKAGINVAGATAVKKQFAENKKYCPQIIGLGGVGKEQISILQEHGFDGAAMLGAIWQAADPVVAWKEIYKLTTSL